MLRKRMPAVVFALTAMLASVPTASEASQYLGERCLRFTDAGAVDGYSLARLGITLEGDGHLSVNGRIAGYEGGIAGPAEAINGNAERVGAEYVMTLTIASSELPTGGEFVLTVAKVRLDAATLNGTFRAMSIGSDAGAGPEVEEGTVEIVPACTIP